MTIKVKVTKKEDGQADGKALNNRAPPTFVGGNLIIFIVRLK